MTTMNSLQIISCILLALLVLAASGAWLSRTLASGSTGARPIMLYRKRPTLLTPAERSFYGVLRQAVGEQLTVFAKVRLADLLELPTGVEQRQSLLNRITSKHIDFVLCHPENLEIVAVLELDDSSHRRASAKAGDAFKDDAFTAAGLPLLRIRAKRHYSPAEIRTSIQSLVAATLNAAVTPRP